METKDPLHRALDVFVHTPIGLALMAARTVPALVTEVVSRGCAQVGGAEANLRKARMIGQVAVTFGSYQLRRQFEAAVRPPTATNGARRPEPEPGPASQPARASEPGPAFEPGEPGRASEPAVSRATRGAAAGKTPARPASRRPSADRRPPPDLAIPAYDGLSASQVVTLLGGLTPAELDAVRRHEAAGRGRKTVLAAVDRLLR